MKLRFDKQVPILLKFDDAAELLPSEGGFDRKQKPYWPEGISRDPEASTFWTNCWLVTL